MLVFLSKTAQILASLSLLVFIHELGHFLAARMFGIRVEKFYIFFDAGDKKLFSFTRGETEYGIGWLPLGGYVKIAGMIDESLDTEGLAKDPEPWEFRAKPAWQRLIVMLGGIIMNVILGVLLFIMWIKVYEQDYLPASELQQTGVFTTDLAKEYGFQDGDVIMEVRGEEPQRFNDFRPLRLAFGGDVVVKRQDPSASGGFVTKTITVPKNYINEIRDQLFVLKEVVNIREVQAGSNAEEAGLLAGDTLLRIQGNEIKNFAYLQKVLAENKEGEVDLVIKRGNEKVSLTSKVSEEGFLGFAPGIKLSDQYKLKGYTYGEAVKYGSKEAFTTVILNAIGLWKIVTGKMSAKKNLQSPIGIARQLPAQWIWSVFWKFTAMISMVLAFMNLLPIPALDGGHVVFLLAEMIYRKPLPDKFLIRAQVVGMIILLTFMALILGKDTFEAIRDNFFK